ncbi:MAG: hypothetical protein GQ532_05740 [Methylomarinum sp.]|nr:hypothetical protein [Methylomarinum sp.]
MCSSPKGSSQCFRQTKRKEVSRSEYEEYASMIQRASAVYDRIEQEKAERQLLLANQKTANNVEQKQLLKDQGNAQAGLFSAIKSFLLQPVF